MFDATTGVWLVHWYTWLGFFGLVLGLAVSAVGGWSPLRSGLAGLGAGIVAVILINLVTPEPAPCLPNAKGWDILRAYDLTCRAHTIKACLQANPNDPAKCRG